MQTPAEVNLYREGGPAFPVSIPGCGDNGWHGMTLRDWFAGQVLAGGIALGPKGAASFAYEIADAMLAQRTLSAGDQNG